MTSPDYLPSLSAGAHDADDGEACVMEYVSLLAGEAWSDRPECTHPLLAHEVRMLNDGPALTARLRLRQVAAVLRLLDPSVRVRVAAVVARAEREASRLDGSDLEGIDRTRGDLPLDRESDDAPTIEEARETARSFPCPETVSDDPAHAAHHLQLARMAFVGLAGEIEAAEAWAFAAQVVAHRVAASGECRADCGDSTSHARMRVRELADLLDEYDVVTGREARRLRTDEFRELSALVDEDRPLFPVGN